MRFRLLHQFAIKTIHVSERASYAKANAGYDAGDVVTEIRGKKRERLNQEDTKELVEWRMSPEMKNECEVKNSWSKTMEGYIDRLFAICQLDHVVSETYRDATPCDGAIVREAFRDRGVARKLVEILKYVKPGKTDPSQNDKGGDNLSTHESDDPRNHHGACQL